MSEESGRAIPQFDVLAIKECARCGKTGDDGEEYGVDGIARIGGNLCLECVRELLTEAQDGDGDD